MNQEESSGWAVGIITIGAACTKLFCSLSSAHPSVGIKKLIKRVYPNNTTWKEGRTPKIQGMKPGDEIKMKNLK